LTTYNANLEEETVQGGGQTLNAMLSVMECKTTSHAGIIQAVRSDFVQSLQSDEYLVMSKQDKAESYYDLVQATVTEQFSAQCKLV